MGSGLPTVSRLSDPGSQQMRRLLESFANGCQSPFITGAVKKMQLEFGWDYDNRSVAKNGRGSEKQVKSIILSNPNCYSII